MKHRLNQHPLTVFLIFTVLMQTFSSTANAAKESFVLVADGGMSFLHPAANPTVIKVGVEAGIGEQGNKGFFGGYASYHMNTAPQLGAVVRFSIPGLRILWVQLNLDLIGLLIGAIAVVGGSYSVTSNMSVFSLAGWGLGAGLNIPFGKSITLMPYASYDSFAFPFNVNYIRYYAPVVGAKLALSF